MKIDEIVREFRAKLASNENTGAFVLIYGYREGGKANLCLTSNVPPAAANSVLPTILDATPAAVETVKKVFEGLATSARAGEELSDVTLGAAAITLIHDLLTKLTFKMEAEKAAPPLIV
jgi:hypothetical protein